MNGDISEISRSRIVHVVRQFHPGVGGLENFVDQLARRQADAGHKVRVREIGLTGTHKASSEGCTYMQWLQTIPLIAWTCWA